MGTLFQDWTVGRNITLTVNSSVEFNGTKFELSVEDSHGIFVLEEEFELGLWIINVWIENFMCAVVQWYWKCVI
jgi:hypothetical protein